MLKINKALIEKNKALIGKKVRSSYNDHWYWNGATVIEATDREYGMNYLLLEKNGNKTWTSEPVIEVLE
jgi:hypothetical protein